jgi:hypothetical protein
MTEKKEENWSYAKTLVITGIIIILGLIFYKTAPLPPNCHRTPSVDVGGGEVECD